MFKWYFDKMFIENNVMFWICIAILITIILLTIFLTYKELKGNKYVNK